MKKNTITHSRSFMFSPLVPTCPCPCPLIRARPHLFGPIPARSGPSRSSLLIPARPSLSVLIPSCPHLFVCACACTCLYMPALMLVCTHCICTCVYAPVLVRVHSCLHLQSFVSTQLTLFVRIWGVDRVLPGASFVPSCWIEDSRHLD